MDDNLEDQVKEAANKMTRSTVFAKVGCYRIFL